MTGVFLDTSALFDAADRTSAHHSACADELRRLLRSTDPLFTTTLIVAEVHALTLSRAGPERAHQAAQRLTESSRIEVIDATSAVVDDALILLEGRPDKRYSLADAASFTIMRSRSIDTAFSLDIGYRAEGFLLIPAL